MNLEGPQLCTLFLPPSWVDDAGPLLGLIPSPQLWCKDFEAECLASKKLQLGCTPTLRPWGGGWERVKPKVWLLTFLKRTSGSAELQCDRRRWRGGYKTAELSWVGSQTPWVEWWVTLWLPVLTNTTTTTYTHRHTHADNPPTRV